MASACPAGFSRDTGARPAAPLLPPQAARIYNRGKPGSVAGGLASGLENRLAGGLLVFFVFLMINRSGHPNVPAVVKVYLPRRARYTVRRGKSVNRGGQVRPPRLSHDLPWPLGRGGRLCPPWKTKNARCRCFVQAPASKFIVMRVRLGWCAKGHKIYTGSGRMSLRPVCCCSCY